MFDDLPGLIPDADLLDSLAEIHIGDGVRSAYDEEVIHSVLDSSLQNLHIDFAHLSPDVTAVLHEALGLGSDALGTVRLDAIDLMFANPFG